MLADLCLTPPLRCQCAVGSVFTDLCISMEPPGEGDITLGIDT